MTRYYDPATGTEALEGIHDLNGCTKDEDMPQESRDWFTRPEKDGMKWENDPTGKFPVEVAIPPPTSKETGRSRKIMGSFRACRHGFRHAVRQPLFQRRKRKNKVIPG